MGISPSMDICVSSNFERFLFHCMDEDSGTLKALMESFEGKTDSSEISGVGSAFSGTLRVEGKALAMAREHMQSARAGNEECEKIIRAYLKEFDYLLCPHSACGISASIQLGYQHDSTMVNLATAHPGKFYDPITQALGAETPLPALPDELEILSTLSKRTTPVANDLGVCQNLVLERTEGKQEKQRYNTRGQRSAERTSFRQKVPDMGCHADGCS